ncbi:MAG TPA: hypothetical protein PKN32_04090 [Bacteroidales bacterium]|nr:hypothetical protein [Bacteroidales bacterium]
MNIEILDKYLRDLKFIVVADIETGKPFAIHFGFTLPNLHSEIFADAEKKFETYKKGISVQGGGRISKIGNKIVFHSQSEKYGRYEDDVVLKLAPLHEFFLDGNFEFYSKAGETDIRKII